MGRKATRTNSNWRFPQWEKWAGDRYNRLLTALIVLLLSVPLQEYTRFGTIAYAVIVFLIVAIIIQGRLLPRRGLLLYILLASMGFLTLILDEILQRSPHLGVGLSTREQMGLETMGLLINAGFFAIAIYSITRSLFLENRISNDTIKGGICVYLMLGIVWSFFYQIARLWNPDSFVISCEDGSINLLYFSFTTLSTLGYGDIIPVTEWVRVLANLEAIAGLMYPTIFIARLVGLYSHEDA